MIPPFSKVVAALVQGFVGGRLLPDLGISMARAGSAFGIYPGKSYLRVEFTGTTTTLGCCFCILANQNTPRWMNTIASEPISLALMLRP